MDGLCTNRSPSGVRGSLVLERPLHADALTLALGIPEEAPVGQMTDAGGVRRRPGHELALLVERVDLLIGVAEVLENLTVVLAEARCGGHNLGGIVLEAVRDADALHLAEDLVLPLDEVLALGVLRIVFNVAGLIRALVGDAGLVEDLLKLGAGVLRAEVRERLVRLLAHGGVEREAGDALRQARRDARRADADDGIALLNRSWTVDGDKQLLVVLRGVEREAGREVGVVAGAVRHNYGGILSPFNAWLVARGLATAPLRMKQHCSVAMAVAEFLELCPATRFVWYPGLKSHPQHALAEKLMHGQYSGMIAFDLKGDEKQHEAFLDALHLVTHAVSLGDIESLIVYYDRHSDKLPHYPAVYQEGFFRFSVGLEDTEDIIADLQQAMQAAGML